jgi:hypothetical protein
MSVILRCFLEGQLALFSGSMALNGNAPLVLMRETEGRQRLESEWVRGAWDLRIDGCSVREIAQRLGISYAQARGSYTLLTQTRGRNSPRPQR